METQKNRKNGDIYDDETKERWGKIDDKTRKGG